MNDTINVNIPSKIYNPMFYKSVLFDQKYLTNIMQNCSFRFCGLPHQKYAFNQWTKALWRLELYTLNTDAAYKTIESTVWRIITIQSSMHTHTLIPTHKMYTIYLNASKFTLLYLRCFVCYEASILVEITYCQEWNDIVVNRAKR